MFSFTISKFNKMHIILFCKICDRLTYVKTYIKRSLNMSEINDFARDLVKRQIDVYNEYKSKKYDMTQPLSVLICCSIILFSDYIENNGKNSLIEEIKKNDKDCELKQLIYDIYGDYFNKRVEKYCKDKIKNENNEKEFINEELNEYEVFFQGI